MSISLKGVDADSYEKACAQLARIINRESRRFQFLLESDKLTDVDKALLVELLERKMTEDAITNSLQALTELLEINYDKQVVVLIDEYDVPLAKAHVYCPWDVVNYCNDHLNNPDAEPENYWMNTSGNSVINHLVDSINEPDMLTKTELEWLVNGKTVIKRIDEMVTYDELYSSMDNLWSTLFMTGYLTQRGRECDGRYCIAVPNREIRNIITERVMRLFGNEVKQDGKMVNEFCDALLNENTSEAEKHARKR